MTLEFVIGFAVGVAFVIFFMALPLSKISEEERMEIKRMVLRNHFRKH